MPDDKRGLLCDDHSKVEAAVNGRCRYVALLTTIVCVLLFTGVSAAQELINGNGNGNGSSLETLLAECRGIHAALAAKIERVRTTNALIAIGGALVAAIGSLVAGFSTKERQRHVSAVVAVLGAVVPLLPQLLPDHAELRKQFRASDLHLLAGQKVYLQIEDVESEEAKRQFRKYSKARFLECSSPNAREDVPDLPKVTADVAGLSIVEGAAMIPRPAPSAIGLVEGAMDHSTRQPVLREPSALRLSPARR